MATRKKIQKPAVKKEEVKKEKQERAPMISAIDFVKVFQASDSTTEVAEHFDRDSQWVSAFAARLRGKGVNLKKMPRSKGGSRLDIDELNALCD